MYPNNPQNQWQPQPEQPQPNSLEYLNQISGPQTVKTVSPLLLWGGIGGILLLIVVLFLGLSAAGGPSSSERFTAYMYRLQAIEEIADDNSREIKASDLRGINSSMVSILGTANQEGEAELAAAGVENLPKRPETSPLSTEFGELATTLDNARLNAQFDRTYSREMGYQLATLRAEIAVLYEQSRATSLREYLEKTDRNLEPLVGQFTGYNNAG